LLSPSGSNSFWAEARDGKSALFVGDQDGKNPKQVASLSEYTSYGWFTDDYLLVSKGSSELYIMSKAGGKPQKITDYYKPSVNYQGYGGGYGGL
jgi:Tol biopolymer transport system component